MDDYEEYIMLTREQRKDQVKLLDPSTVAKSIVEELLLPSEVLVPLREFAMRNKGEWDAYSDLA